MSLKQRIKQILLPNEEDGEIIYHNPNNKGIKNKKISKQNTPKVYMVNNYYEVGDIAKNLFVEQSVIVNLTNLATKEKYRVVDFLSGVIYSMNGKRTKLDSNIYLFAPSDTE